MENKEQKKRTLQQNRAMHVYFQGIADTFNDAGLDMRKVMKPEIDIPWTTESVKEHLWRSIQKAMYPEIKSTTELHTDQVSPIYETLNRHLSEKFHVTIPFPDKWEQLQETYNQHDYKSTR